MPIVRTQSGLVETEGEDITQLAKLQGVPVVPQSPAGAAGIGASPDSAKMAGSSAQKQAVLKDTTATQDTLQTANRTVDPTKATQAANTEAQTKAAQLSTLGSLQTRVQALINNELKLQSPATVQVSKDAIGVVGGTQADRDTATSLIERIAANPNDQATLAEASQFWVDKLGGSIETFNPANFLSTAEQSLGKQAATQVQDTVTIGDVGVTADEEAGLTAAFGDDSWKGLTVPQLADRIEQLRQAEYNRVGALRAELSGAQGQQRQLLVDELKSLGVEGATGTEQSMRELSKQIEGADVVKVGDEEYKVEDLLKDQSISDLITRMLGSPNLAAKVAETNPEFAKWVQDNKTSLSDVAKSIGDSTSTLRQTQADKVKLATTQGGSLNPDIMKVLVPGWDSVSGSIPDVSQVGVLQVLNDPNLDKTTATEITNALNALSFKDPDQMAKLAAMSAEDFKAAFDYANTLQDNTLLQDMLGLDGVDEFVIDEASQLEIAKYKGIADQLQTALSQDETGALDVAINNPATKKVLFDLIKSGDFKDTDVQKLAANPTKLQEYVDYHKKYKTLEKAWQSKDLNLALDTIFGSDVDIDALNKEYRAALDQKRLDPTGVGAQTVKEFQANLDFDKSGKIDSRDFAAIMQNAMGQKKTTNTATGKVTATPFSISEVLDGNKTTGNINSKSLESILTADDYSNIKGETDYTTALSSYLNDDKIDESEIAKLAEIPGALEKLFANTNMKGKLPTNIRSPQQYKDYLRGKAVAEERQSFITNLTTKLSSVFNKNIDDVLSELGRKVDTGAYLTPDEIASLGQAQTLMTEIKAANPEQQKLLDKYYLAIENMKKVNSAQYERDIANAKTSAEKAAIEERIKHPFGTTKKDGPVEKIGGGLSKAYKSFTGNV